MNGGGQGRTSMTELNCMHSSPKFTLLVLYFTQGSLKESQKNHGFCACVCTNQNSQSLKYNIRDALIFFFLFARKVAESLFCFVCTKLNYLNRRWMEIRGIVRYVQICKKFYTCQICSAVDILHTRCINIMKYLFFFFFFFISLHIVGVSGTHSNVHSCQKASCMPQIKGLWWNVNLFIHYKCNPICMVFITGIIFHQAGWQGLSKSCLNKVSLPKTNDDTLWFVSKPVC